MRPQKAMNKLTTSQLQTSSLCRVSISSAATVASVPTLKVGSVATAARRATGALRCFCPPASISRPVAGADPLSTETESGAVVAAGGVAVAVGAAPARHHWKVQCTHQFEDACIVNGVVTISLQPQYCIAQYWCFVASLLLGQCEPMGSTDCQVSEFTGHGSGP